MHAEHGFAGKLCEEALVHHHLAAGDILFGRLEDEMHGTVEVLRLCQILRSAQQHDGVTVMAATMHLTLMLRLVTEVVHLDQIERIHIGAQPDGAIALAHLQRADHTGFGQAAMHRHTEGFERRGDELGGAMLLKRGLGVHVQIMPPLGQLGFIGDNLRDQFHFRALRLRIELGKKTESGR